jgi:hypothetical protein
VVDDREVQDGPADLHMHGRFVAVPAGDDAEVVHGGGAAGHGDRDVEVGLEAEVGWQQPVQKGAADGAVAGQGVGAQDADLAEENSPTRVGRW